MTKQKKTYPSTENITALIMWSLFGLSTLSLIIYGGYSTAKAYLFEQPCKVLKKEQMVYNTQTKDTASVKGCSEYQLDTVAVITSNQEQKYWLIKNTYPEEERHGREDLH